MNVIRPILFSTFTGYAVSYAIGPIWFYSIQEHVFRPIDIASQQNPDFSTSNSIKIFYSGWKSLFLDFYGYTDYEAEIAATNAREANKYKVDKY